MLDGALLCNSAYYAPFVFTVFSFDNQSDVPGLQQGTLAGNNQIKPAKAPSETTVILTAGTAGIR
jgi:hypothetical protein